MRDPSSVPIAFYQPRQDRRQASRGDRRHAGKQGRRLLDRARDVEPGRNFGDEIIRGIEACRAFILVLSPASNGSDFVAKELATAVGKKKTVLPIRIKDVEPSAALALFIAGTHWIDAFGGKLGPEADRLASLLSGQPRPAAAPLPAPRASRPRWGRRGQWRWRQQPLWPR